MQPAGFRHGNLATGHHTSKMFLTCHDLLPLSSPTLGHGWRLTAKLFSGSGFAAAVDAAQCSGFAGTAIVGSVIAARPAGLRPGSSNGAAQTPATNEAWRDNWITVTGSRNTANARLAGRA